MRDFRRSDAKVVDIIKWRKSENVPEMNGIGNGALKNLTDEVLQCLISVTNGVLALIPQK